MTADLILYEKKDGIATITMDRPKKKNSLIPSMIIDMIDALERARQDHAVRAIVLRGGGGTFCAGDDLHHSYEERFEFGQPDLHTRLRTGYPRLIIDIMTLRKPVVAMVQGYAYGGGFDIALACDFRFAAKSAKFAAAYQARNGRRMRLSPAALCGPGQSDRAPVAGRDHPHG